jgi:hypothetical protein
LEISGKPVSSSFIRARRELERNEAVAVSFLLHHFGVFYHNPGDFGHNWFVRQQDLAESGGQSVGKRQSLGSRSKGFHFGP